MKVKIIFVFFLIPYLGLSQDGVDKTNYYTNFKSQKGVVLIEKLIKSDTLKFNNDLKLVINKKSISDLGLPAEHIGFWELKLIEKRYQQFGNPYISTFEFILESNEIRELIKLSEFISNRKKEIIKYESNYYQRIFLKLNKDTDFSIYFSKYKHNNSFWVNEEFDFQNFILIIEKIKKLI